MIGYWRRPDHTASARRGELLRTGDIGHLDDAGLLHVADRRDDIIVRGGSNVSPAEVARVLLDHPAVADCLVLGRPHARLGQEVMAVVEPHHACGDLTGAEIRRHCSARLAGFKIPAEVLVVAELPRNSMGKVAREQVRAIVVGPPAPNPEGG